MENSTKALYIVASTIIAVLILSLVVLTFKRISESQTVREKIYDEKNLAAFNAEFEAFNKRLMYGADVISCINKVTSNNKIARDNNDPDLYIDVWVHLDTDVSEEFKIYKVVKGKNKTIDTSDEDDKNNIKAVFATHNAEGVRGLFKANSNINTTVTSGTALGGLFTNLTTWNDTVNKKVLAKNSNDKSNKKYYYYLLDNGKIPANESDINTNPLGCLVNTKEEYTWNFSEGGNSYCVKWTTAFKDFRKMAFSCTKMEFDENTGRVNKMIFEGRAKNK